MEKNNCYLINAPAGSGKTTYIHNKIMQINIKQSNARILCITYTNRATEELKSKFEYYNSTKIEVYTIHSFLKLFMDDYFKNKKVINYYFEEYDYKIKEIVENEDDENNLKKINRYKEKFGEEISYEIIRKNISKIYYNETNFNSYLYGGLSHDDLIKFSYNISNRYEKILFKLSNMYDYVFIDEYQDTPIYILEMFYNCLKYSNMNLYLFGDKMQQIYDNYNCDFDVILKGFNKSISLNNNYRSSKKIVDILNKIYNDNDYIQQSENIIESKTVCIITDNFESTLEKFNDFYKLFLLNKEKYTQIGASNLYSSIMNIEDYSHNGKYNVSDALNDNIDDNKDMLFKMLYIINYMIEMYLKKNFGEIVRIVEKYNKIFNVSKISITDFDSIKDLKKFLKFIHEEYNNDDNNILDFLLKIDFINEEYLENITSNLEYEAVLKVKIKEFLNYVKYTKRTDCSTQHGVKGEGHDNVIFVSESSSNPNVNIYEFYKVFSKYDIRTKDLENFNWLYTKYITEIEALTNTSISKLNKEIYETHLDRINEIISKMYNEIKNYELFDLIKEKYKNYIIKQKITALKDFLKKGYYQSILSAYKLFYVGCSRARKNLIILVSKSKTKDYQLELIEKFKKIGFDVELQ